MSLVNSKKMISVVVPVYSEQECLMELYERTSETMKQLSNYSYEIVFFDDGSTDRSREIIESLCEKDKHCKAIFFSRNYGYNNAIFYAVEQAKGDCAVLLHADLQNPPEVIPDFIRDWEAGHDVVFGVKNKSRENKLMFFLRTLAYWLLNLVFGMKLIPHATDFELIDSSIIKSLQGLNYYEPFLRAILLERTNNKALVYYTQDKRAAGKSSFTFSKYYDLTLSWITFSSKVLPRRFLCVGLVMFFVGILELFIGFLPKVSGMDYTAFSTYLIFRIGFIIFGVMICFVSVISEFIISNQHNRNNSFKIIENKRINY